MTELSLLAVAADESRPVDQPTYSYLFTDLLTDRPIGTFDLAVEEFDLYVNQPGTLRGTLPVPNAAVGRRSSAIVAGRTAVYAMRSLGSLVEVWWGGIVWTAPRSAPRRGAASISVQAATFDSYLDRVNVRADLALPGEDQLLLERYLWGLLQTDARSDLGVLVPVSGESGVLRDLAVKASETRSYGAVVAELKERADSWESVVQVSLQPDGSRLRQLVQGYPMLGTPAVHRFAKPGRIISYDISDDATGTGTRFRARGDAASTNQADEQEPLMSATVEASDLLGAGWPLLDVVTDHSGVTVQAALDGHAQWSRDRLAGTLRRPSFTVDSGSFSPGRLGDLVSLQVEDELYPDGMSVLARAVGLKVTPPARGRREQLSVVIDEEVA